MADTADTVAGIADIAVPAGTAVGIADIAVPVEGTAAGTAVVVAGTAADTEPAVVGPADNLHSLDTVRLHCCKLRALKQTMQ